MSRRDDETNRILAIIEIPGDDDHKKSIQSEIDGFKTYHFETALEAAKKTVGLIKQKKINLKKNSDIVELVKVFKSSKSKKATALAEYLFAEKAFDIGSFKIDASISKSKVVGNLNSHSECWLSGKAILVPVAARAALLRELVQLGWSLP